MLEVGDFNRVYYSAVTTDATKTICRHTHEKMILYANLSGLEHRLTLEIDAADALEGKAFDTKPHPRVQTAFTGSNVAILEP